MEGDIDDFLEKNNFESEWFLFVSRPLSLLLVSLWQYCYEKYLPLITDGTTGVPDGIFIQGSNGVTDNYRNIYQYRLVKDVILKQITVSPYHVYKLLEQSSDLNKSTELFLKNGLADHDIDYAIDHGCKLVVFGAILPYIVLELSAEFKSVPKEMIEICKRLRTVSYYPKYINEILIPELSRHLKHHVSDIKQIELLTIDEIKSINLTHIEERVSLSKNNTFIYVAIDGKSEIYWKSIKDINRVDTIVGQTAYGGKLSGCVKVCLSLDGNDLLDFTDGDILVSINSNPSLMNFLERAGALISDEGGVSCHATLIAQKLKIPCIVGTKNATKVLKTGDIVEVDADKGVVKILKRAK